MAGRAVIRSPPLLAPANEQNSCYISLAAGVTPNKSLATDFEDILELWDNVVEIVGAGNEWLGNIANTPVEM